MALQRDTHYPGRWTTGNAAHPQGAFKNRTAPGALDGSYIEQDWANDWDGFFAALLGAASITPNGNVDTATSSQYFTAMQTVTKGRLIGAPQIFNTAGTFTYTPTVGTTSVVVEVQAAGGASGGAPATGAGVSSLGGPGGAGAYAKGRFTSAFAGVTITVGAGGTGVSGAAGNNGGSSSFGALVSCPGGIGGITAGPSSSVFEAASNNTAAPSGGNIISAAGPRGQLTFSTAPTAIFFGLPGASLLGLAAGGGGPANGNTPSLAVKTGSAGDKGLVIVWEYS